MSTRTLLSAFFLSAGSLAALAASPEEAAQIKTALQAYAGSEPGVVEVTPQGNGYAIKFDAMPYLAKMTAETSLKAYADTLTVTAEPLGNGQWKVAASGPWGFQFSDPGKLDVALRFAGQDWSGVFDEAIGGFASSEAKFNGISYSQKFNDPVSFTSGTVTYMVQSATSSAKAVADGAGGSDGTATMTMSGLSMMASGTGASPSAMNYSVTANGLSYATETKGLRSRALLELLAWFVARPAKDLIIRDQAQLKEKLAAALPVFKSVNSKASYDGLNIATAMGAFALSGVSGDVNMNGAVKDGFVRERLAFNGLAMPPGLVPAWAQELVPTSLGMDFSLAGFDLDTPARAAIAQFDLSKDPPLPPETGQMMMPALVPTNALAITFGASEIAAPAYSLSYDGTLNASLVGFPTGKFNVRLKGMDAIMAKVQAAAVSDPSAAQAFAGLIAAKGMGKAEADGSLSYAIDIQPMGQVLVNGVNVTAMAGAPQPQQ